MSRWKLFSLTCLALLAFAANSILCRLALRTTSIDPATFTAVRLVSGAIVLAALVRRRGQATGGQAKIGGDWGAAAALFLYAAAFSSAYRSLPSSVGALLLFGSVQVTMIGLGLLGGERLGGRRLLGLVLASGGLGYLMAPGLSAPPLAGSLSMALAGAAWGVYSIRGRGAADPVGATAGNFLRAVPLALLWCLFELLVRRSAFGGDRDGLLYASVSGAVTSGLGYVVWYAAVRQLSALTASAVQLTVPVLTAIGGVALLGETLTTRLVMAGAAVLGGIAIFVAAPRTSRVFAAPR